MHVNSILPTQLISFKEHSVKAPYPEARGSEVTLTKVSGLSVPVAAVLHSSPNLSGICSLSYSERDKLFY